MILNPFGKIWVPQFSCVMLLSLHTPVYCVELSIFLAYSGPYTYRLIVGTSVSLSHAVVLTPSYILWGLQFNCVMLSSLHPPELGKNFSLVVSCSGPYTFRYMLRYSLLLCHAMVLSSSGTLWVTQFICVMLWYLHRPVYFEECSFLVSCYFPYNFRYSVSISV